MRELMGEAKLGTALQFPMMRLRASDLAALIPGTVLRLPLVKHSVSELRVGGLQFGLAHPVRTGEHRGAQLQGGKEKDDLDYAPVDQTNAETLSVN